MFIRLWGSSHNWGLGLVGSLHLHALLFFSQTLVIQIHATTKGSVRLMETASNVSVQSLTMGGHATEVSVTFGAEAFVLVGRVQRWWMCCAKGRSLQMLLCVSLSVCFSVKKVCKRHRCRHGECVITSTPPYYACICRAAYKPPNCRTREKHQRP